MKIYYNGDPMITQASDLGSLLKEKAVDVTSVASAVNGDFVPRSRYHEIMLEENMKIEVLAPMQGG